MVQIVLGGRILARILPWEAPGLSCKDTVTETEAGVYRWQRTFAPIGGGKWEAKGLTMALSLEMTPDFLMIPGVSYNGNLWGDGKEPRGFTYEGQPWSFAQYRTTIPGCSFARDGQFSVGLYAGEYPSDWGVAASIDRRGKCTKLVIRLPEEEMPSRYLRKGQPFQPGYTTIQQTEGAVTVTAWILVQSVRGEETGYGKLLHHALHSFAHALCPWHTPEKLWELGVRYAKESLWQEVCDFKAFNIGLNRREGRWQQRALYRVDGSPEDSSFEAGWCGQNISLACSLLEDYLRNGCEDSLQKGIACLDSWVQYASLPNGLMLTRFSPAYLTDSRALEKAVIDSCNLGAIIENFPQAEALAVACGYKRPAFGQAARRVAELLLELQAEDGLYPAALRHDGSVLRMEGSTGGFVIPGILRLYGITGEVKYLESAQRAFDRYFGEFNRTGYSTAGALDTYCIDKESMMPLLEGALLLYSITSDKAYVRKAVAAAEYLSTWQFHHSVPFPEGSNLAGIGYDTQGGTLVSTQHNHIDAYALKYIPALLQLSALTGDTDWRERAQSIWNNATLSVSDGSYTVDGWQRPAGSQDEGFLQGHWGTPFSLTHWLVAWPTAFRLEVLRRTEGLQTTDYFNIR